MEQKKYTPPPVKGYRELTQEEVDLMNRIKDTDLGALISHLEQQKGLDQRWVAIGKTHLQQGIMALVRAVAQPTNF